MGSTGRSSRGDPGDPGDAGDAGGIRPGRWGRVGPVLVEMCILLSRRAFCTRAGTSNRTSRGQNASLECKVHVSAPSRGRAGPSAGVIAGTAVRAGARDGAVCPNLLQRPGSGRNAGRETLIFRASSRRRSRPGAPLQQIRTRPRPGSPQEPHPHHPAPAHPRHHVDPDPTDRRARRERPTAHSKAGGGAGRGRARPGRAGRVPLRIPLPLRA